MMFDLKWFV